MGPCCAHEAYLVALSMSELVPYLNGRRRDKVVGITFDDGYRNTLTSMPYPSSRRMAPRHLLCREPQNRRVQ